MVQILHCFGDGFGPQQVLLLHIIEERMRVPERIRESPIPFHEVFRRFQLAFCQIVLRCNIVLERLAPVRNLVLHDLRGVLHHLGDIGRCCFLKQVLTRALQAVSNGFLLARSLYQPRRQFLHSRNIGAQFFGITRNFRFFSCHSLLFAVVCNRSIDR